MVKISVPDIISVLVFFAGTRTGRLIYFKLKSDSSVKMIQKKNN